MATAGQAHIGTGDNWRLSRARILSDPGLILDDPEVMEALLSASAESLGTNIVDMRGLAMERLQARYDRLDETHRAVIAAAYDNISVANQVHRAVLAVLDAPTFESLLGVLDHEVADILKVCNVRLVLESPRKDDDPALRRLGRVLLVAEPGFVTQCMSDQGRPTSRQVVLRQVAGGSPRLHGARAADIRSEVAMRLDLGPGRLPAMLVMGSEDPHQFKPGQGTDLLSFFIGVFERTMRRYLG